SDDPSLSADELRRHGHAGSHLRLRSRADDTVDDILSQHHHCGRNHPFHRHQLTEVQIPEVRGCYKGNEPDRILIIFGGKTEERPQDPQTIKEVPFPAQVRCSGRAGLYLNSGRGSTRHPSVGGFLFGCWNWIRVGACCVYDRLSAWPRAADCHGSRTMDEGTGNTVKRMRILSRSDLFRHSIGSVNQETPGRRFFTCKKSILPVFGAACL